MKDARVVLLLLEQNALKPVGNAFQPTGFGVVIDIER